MEDDSVQISQKWLLGLSEGTLSHQLEAIAMEGLQILHSQKGFIRCNFVVPSRASDADGNWHVGAMATLIDDVGAAAIYSLVNHVKASLDFSISFYSTAKIGEEVEIEAKVEANKGKLSHVLVEFRKVKKAVKIDLNRDDSVNSGKWKSPDLDWVKISCDGSFDPKNGEAAIGIVIRDYQGQLVDRLGKKVQADEALMTKALAVREGLKLAARKNFSRVIVENDSAGVVQDLTGSLGTSAWKTAPVVRETVKLFADLKVSLVKRQANGAADWVARQHNMEMDLSDWINRPPSSLVFILSKDGLPCPH
ncbi:Thioesterase superfamily [Corchorus olitorius]|uniref:Acyl-coenzyme A thioesterase 13 n=1 Tax=Corchorus olitorius TaxID=93759 RepID=A0A1R3H8M2_9ROSI|nr:Thioesterase superfamily [Corchorus olitorius]